MSMTDPIADLLTRIRNAQMAAHESVEVPYSKIKKEIVEILRQEGYITAYKLNEKKPFSILAVVLKYTGKEPAIRKLRRISNPGRRVYARKGDIPLVLGGMGINILSTSEGVLTGKKATEQGVGGEILCELY